MSCGSRRARALRAGTISAVQYFQQVQAGVVYANRIQGATTGAMIGDQPFSGWKHSGISGKGAGGPYYLQQFLQEQSQTYYV